MSIGILTLESLNAESGVAVILAEEVEIEGERVAIVVGLDDDTVCAVTLEYCGPDDSGAIAILATKTRATIDDTTDDNGSSGLFPKVIK